LSLVQAVALLLGLAIAVALYVVLRRQLAARDAHRPAHWSALSCYLVAAFSWLAVLVTPTPVWVAWLASVPAAVVTVAPDLLVRFTGGSQSAPHLRREVEILLDLVAAPRANDTPAQLQALRARVRSLERYRTADTAELIDTVETWAFDRLDGMPLEPVAEGVLLKRIERLQAALLVPAGGWSPPPPARRPQPPPDEGGHGQDDEQEHERVVGLQEAPDVGPVLAELHAGPDEQGAPQESAGGGIGHELAEVHPGNAGREADERAHDGHEAGHEDRD
jgi:hypothetical protein